MVMEFSATQLYPSQVLISYWLVGMFGTRHERPSHIAPTNLAELYTALANIWQVILIEWYQIFIESMPYGMAAVIKARGGPTRY
ncbi:hypothetical protein TNCV_4517431 [Trichonephila clavipes]|nr:hypothetical protein TNCV_4517431 [Trichonephila clavipes]